MDSLKQGEPLTKADMLRLDKAVDDMKEVRESLFNSRRKHTTSYKRPSRKTIKTRRKQKHKK